MEPNEKKILLRGHKDLEVYKLAYRMAVEIFNVTKDFPKEEKYSLVDQIRRSSRSVATNISEAWAKRMYPNHFVSKISDSFAEAHETVTWLDFSYEHSYIKKEKYVYFLENYDHICRMLFKMMKSPDKFVYTL